MKMSRREFMTLAAAGCAARGVWADDGDLDAFQRELDEIAPEDFKAFYSRGVDLPEAERDAFCEKFPGLRRYDEAFEKVFREVRDAEVTGRPAVWFVYNMGIVVKTPQTLFTVDLQHRLAERLAPILDFALITHNHNDHYTERFYRAMDSKEHKIVVTNFLDNYGAYFHRTAPGTKTRGGYTPGPKKFEFGDVTVQTSLSDHNGYLIDFTMPFEITVGDYTIYHTGDSSNVAKLNPSRRPDLWLVHPLNGLKVADGVRKFSPKRTAIVHLQELHHPRGRARWTFKDGQRERAAAEAAGTEAFMPLWGDRIA